MKPVFLSIILLSSLCISAQTPVYKDSTKSIPIRVEDLLKHMTLEEKFWQLFMIPGDLSIGKEKLKNGIFGFQVATEGQQSDAAGQMLNYGSGVNAAETAKLINSIQSFFVNETRLGIPVIIFDEALHGLIRKDATSFPQSIALSTTFDTMLMHRVGKAIAAECKSRGIRQILSPVLDIARDVRWGRVEETYGEDPYLCSQMAYSFISEFEKIGVIATPKHFAVNSGDGGRDSYPIHYNERLLEEIYFPAYKKVFQQAGARSVMVSYNSLDGSPCTANNWLLNEKLKKEWGFKGFTISDACGVGGANVLHYTAKDYAEATRNSLNNGLDVIFQTSYDHYPLFWEAFEKNMIDIKIIDDAVRRVLRAKFELGLFEHPYVNENTASQINNCKEHRLLSKQAAMESCVLLKNEKNNLPISKDCKSIAIIGTDAAQVNLGGYSGPGNNNISILTGIKAITGNKTTIQYAEGCGKFASDYTVIPSTCLTSTLNGKVNNGLTGEYFDNISFSGEPKIKRTDAQIDFGWTLYSPDPKLLPFDWYSVRWTGNLTAPQTGSFKIGIEGNDGYRLFINNVLVSERWIKESYRTLLKDYYFEKDKEYDIRLEYYESTGSARVKLVWNVGVINDWKQKIQEAVNIAKSSERAIVVVAINEGEFNDRATISLPGHQEELIRAVAETGTPTTILLVGGSAVVMTNWIDKVDGIMDVWYSGEMGGEAIADVLFGNYNPAGRLPITFPIHEGQLPLVYNHKPTGRGDDYTNLTGQPLFPFGFGLSYTTFEYSAPQLTKTSISASESTSISFDLKNSGKFDGDEVAQLYIRDELSSVARPVMELKSFQRVHLKAGETKRITFQITPEMLQMLDINLQTVIEPGTFRIMIGASSKDIRIREILSVGSRKS